MDLIVNRMSGTFNHIAVCLKSRDEPLYLYLEKLIADPSMLSFYEVTNEEDIPSPDEFKDKGQTLMCFDDLVTLKKQKRIEEYFIRGRKVGGGISSVYLTQSYYKTPQLIRQQCNYIVLKKLNSDRDLTRVLSEHSLGVDSKQLRQIYKNATNEKTKFLLLDLDAEDNQKFRDRWCQNQSGESNLPTKPLTASKSRRGVVVGTGMGGERTTIDDLMDLADDAGIKINAIVTKDKLAGLSPKKGNYIINMQDSTDGSGTHWVGLVLITKNRKKEAFYFDSFGQPPPIAVREFAGRFLGGPATGQVGPPLYYSNKVIQNADYGYCGQYVIHFLYVLSEQKGNLTPLQRIEQLESMYHSNQ
jgi:hypothetical protein